MNQDAFFSLCDPLFAGLRGREHLFCSLGAESSDFVRLNHNRIRQAGSVRSAGLGFNLIDGARQAEAACDLSGDLTEDLARARHLLGRLRERIAHLPDDPYLNYSLEPSTSMRQVGETPPDAQAAVADLIDGGRRSGPGRHLGLRRDRGGPGQFHRSSALARQPELQPGLQLLPGVG